MGSTKYNKRGNKRVTTAKVLTFFIVLGVLGWLFWLTQFERDHTLFVQEVSVQTSPEEVSYHQLPEQAQVVFQLVLNGGPFPYEQDGSIFGNYGHELPVKPRGYYHEYTVRTPGVSHRGARRIVCGGQEQKRPQVCYYTQDHYKSFQQIADAPVL